MPTKHLIKDLSLPFTLKRSLEKTVQTYPNEWIVIHEALQNALDAIQRSGKKQGQVKINLDLDAERVTIEDNGEGFPCDVNLLGFGASNKDPTDYRLGGEIGVGIKTVIACTKDFELWATYIDEKTGALRKWYCSIIDGYKFLKGLKDDIDITYDGPIDISKDKEETGTKISYSFPEEDKRLLGFLIEQIYRGYFSPNRIHDDLAVDIKDKFKLALEHYLRTTGYAANVNNLLNVNPTVPVEIAISVSCGTESLQHLPDEFKQIFNNGTLMVRFKNIYWDAEEAVNRSRKPRPYPIGHPTKTPFPGEGGYIGNYSPGYLYIQKLTDWSEIQKLLINPKMRKQPDLLYYKTYFEKYVMGMYLVVGGREVLRKYLLDFPRSKFIAASGIPSTHNIHTPTDVGGLGFINNICLIINLKQKLTYGKQTIKNPWLLKRVYEFFRDAFRATLIHTAECISGKVPEAPPSIVVSPTEVVSRPELGLSFSKIKKVPKEEVELIALFSELIGSGHLTDYEVWALSTREVFDGKMMIHYKEVDINPPHSDRDLSNVEFKVYLSDLIDDFDTGRKVITNLNLIIVWEDDFDRRYSNGHIHYETVPAESSALLNEYTLNYVNKCLRDRRTGMEIPILELKWVVENLKHQAE
jgi:hypothetical protein